jgi:adenosylcobinamide-phosphate synthase
MEAVLTILGSIFFGIYALGFIVVPLLGGWLLDRALGDPAWLPHPVVGFGRLIALGERRLNRGRHRILKGGLLAVGLTAATAAAVWALQWVLADIAPVFCLAAQTLLVFYSLAGMTLVREVREAFRAVAHSLDEGRCQVGRIVGRDTSNLSAYEIRIAALETLAENLNDGVVAPLFWFALGGVPGMVAYKMANTLDSMIGYRTERYAEFGRVAARMDDVAGWIPARLTALLMIVVVGRPGLWRFVMRFGCAHSSPNSGWPEAALAGILDCRFGGMHDYFGRRVEKPYIGIHQRPLYTRDMERAVGVNRRVETVAVMLVIALKLIVVVLFS